MLNFDILEKGLELISPLNFVHDFSSKIFFMLLNDQMLLNELNQISFSHCIWEKSFKSEIKREEIK